MKKKFRGALVVLLVATLNHLFSTAFAQGTAFTYQGRLNNNGSPVTGSYDMTFTLFNTNASGVAIAGPVTNSAVAVSNGLFTTLIDFGNAFNNSSNWLQIAVRTSGANNFTTLMPRQPITPTPYAITAQNVAGLTVQQNTGDSPNVIGGSSVNYVASGVVAATIAGGGALSNEAFIGPVSNTVTANFGTVSGGVNNTVNGEYGTVSGGDDNSVTGQSATVGGGDDNLAFYYATVSGGFDNIATGQFAVIGGGDYNSAAGQYATVGGGTSNSATNDFSTISGGLANITRGEFATISGGNSNSASGQSATVSGGDNNTAIGNNSMVAGGSANYASANYSIVAGGSTNDASANYSIIGGGANNLADAVYSMVGGGINNGAYGDYSVVAGGNGNSTGSPFASVGGGNGNSAAGQYATVAGGHANSAGGDFSFAGGNHASAPYQGDFVWADDNGGNFTAAGMNQFYVRAGGGFAFYTSSGLTAGVTLAAGSGSWSMVSDSNAKENFQSVDGETILAQVTAMPMTTWNYKTQAKSIRHVGPMAQDFHAAFHVGENDTTISTVDEGGVALAAIQGLNQKLEAENAELKKQNDLLADRLNELETTVKTIIEKK
jgi:hypothetical protein